MAPLQAAAHDDRLIGRDEFGDLTKDGNIPFGDEDLALQTQACLSDEHRVVDLEDPALDMKVAVAPYGEAKLVIKVFEPLF